MKIIPINTKDELDSYDIDRIKNLNPDVFIYSYENHGYEGSRFAVWRKDKKWSYQELGHCSCYGPLEDLASSNNMKFTLKQILKVGDTYGEYSKDIKDYLTKYYKK